MERELQQAVGLHRAGDLAGAIRAYRKLLKSAPKNAIIHNLHGLAEFQAGRFEAAVEALAKALRLKPDIPDIDYNLATALQRLGRNAEAIPHFEKALASKPQDADARNNYAMALKAAGRLDEAIGEYRRVLAAVPDHAAAHLNLGNTLATQGREAEALPHFERSIALMPLNPECYVSLGNALRMLNREQESLMHFDRAIALSPLMAEAYACKGLALVSLKRYDEAAGHLLRATQLKPDFAEACVELGHALQMLERHEDAARIYRKAIHRKPDLAEAYYFLAEVLNTLEKFDEMLEPLQQAIALKPDYASAICLLGGYHIMKQEYEVAEQLINKSLEIDCNSAMSHFFLADLYATTGRAELAIRHLDQALAMAPEIQKEKSWAIGITYLSLGELSRGWMFFEHRFLRLLHKRPAWRNYSAPLWDGEKVEGKLLVWGEQGLGDEILYASMLPDLQQFAHGVIVECSPRLEPLFKRSFSGIEISPMHPEKLYPREITAHCSTASLGKFLRPSLESFPRPPLAYLRADEKRTDNLRKLITSSSKRAVGLSWRSVNLSVGAMKSARLTDFGSILAIENCQFVDLQYGDTLEERRRVETEFGTKVLSVETVDKTQDLDGLAALISACDVIVTTSNTTAHLAGALGKPVWVLLPFGEARIWYWFKKRTDSPWYPNMRLVRQALREPWQSVVARAAIEVGEFLRSP